MAKEITIEVIIEKQSRIVLRIWMFRFVLWFASLICPLKLYIVWPYDKSFRCSAGNACYFVQPYGWVPECGCPIHDPDEFDEYVERLRGDDAADFDEPH
jgi:hypothetical protein